VKSSDPRFVRGDAVAALTSEGGLAERVVGPPMTTFRVPPRLDFAQAAALVLNYPTAIFWLSTEGSVQIGEGVLVDGAAGGFGTASIQVAAALGARTIGVVSSPGKAAIAREAGADEVLNLGGAWKDQARDISGGSVSLVIDPVSGNRSIDSLRALRRGGASS
jgi:NADPH2:quinone reductase